MQKDDVIYRQEAIEALRTCYDTETITYTNGNEYIDYDQALDLINALPSAHPERKKGKWLVDEDGNMECPFCGNTCGFGNFCNECGADIRGEIE